MRIYKFRAWNERDSDPKNRMREMVSITNQGLVIMPDGDTWDIPLMQFTGLKDKNGKEIYEGDVIDMGDKLEVRYGFNNGEHEGFYLRRSDGYEYTMHAFTTPLEVIGNRFENPELLNPNT